MTGKFTTGASVTGTSSLLDGSFAGATSGIKIDDGGVVIISSSTESGSSPIVGYQGLTLVTVPEPSSITLAGLGLGVVVLTLVRRRKKVSA